MNASHRLLLVILVSLLVVGCGPLKTRSPLPLALINQAEPEGYSKIRFWGDTPESGLVDSIIESWEQERATLGLAANATQFPPASYLAISGGGSDGAFGAGILSGWSQSGKRPVFKIVTGISTGALTAPFAFLGSAEDEDLKLVYTGVEDKDIAVFAGIFNLLRGDSAYDTGPLIKLAEKTINNGLIDKVAVEHKKGRRLFVGTTNLDAQRPVIWDMGAIACSDREDRYELFRQVLIASAAIPGAFPPVYLKVRAADGKVYDEMHVDGGVTREMFLLPSQLNLAEVRQAHRAVRPDVTLYVIRNARLGPEFDLTQPRVSTIASRSIETLIKAQSIGDIQILYYDSIKQGWKFALASIPEDIASKYKSMFDKERMTKLFERGHEMSKVAFPWRTEPPFVEDPNKAATQPK